MKNVNKDVQSWVKILHKKVVLDYDVAFIEEFNLNLKDICQNIEYWIKAGSVTVLNFSYSMFPRNYKGYQWFSKVFPSCSWVANVQGMQSLIIETKDLLRFLAPA